jgi:hypothetical protein
VQVERCLYAADLARNGSKFSKPAAAAAANKGKVQSKTAPATDAAAKSQPAGAVVEKKRRGKVQAAAADRGEAEAAAAEVGAGSEAQATRSSKRVKQS